jgi:hypothetical protein
MKSNRYQDNFASAKQSAEKIMAKQSIQSRSTAFSLRSITPFFPAHSGRNNRHIVYATQSQQFGITRHKTIHSCVQRTSDDPRVIRIVYGQSGRCGLRRDDLQQAQLRLDFSQQSGRRTKFSVHQTFVWVKCNVIYCVCLAKEMRDGKQRAVSVPAGCK